MNVLLVAEEAAGIQVLRLLASNGHRVAAVLTAPPQTGGGATVAGVADGLGVPVLPSQLVRDPALAHLLRLQEVDLLLNVHSLYVIHGDVLAACRIGAFNMHPGPLPQYAGLNAPSWAIYNGEPRHAVTIHWMEPGIDTGAVAYSTSFEIADDDTGLSLSAKCVRSGLQLVAELLEAAARGKRAIPAERQDVSARRYYDRKTVPQDGRIVWSAPGRQVVDLVRASDYGPFPSPWGRPRARLDGQELTVLRAVRTHEPTSEPPGTIGPPAGPAARVATADEWILLERVAPREAGAALRPGTRLADG